MNGKGLKSSQLTVTVAAVLAVSSSLAPTAFAKSQANAIIGTGSDAIIGTGRADAIIGTGKVEAIIGTGKADAIIGTGKVEAIIGTGKADAIIGTGIEAIIGTGKHQLLALGPIESVDTLESTLRMLGRKVATPHADSLASELAAGNQLFVAITGTLGADGSAKNASLRVVGRDYVAGASKVMATGRLTKVSSTIGRFAIGTLQIDYSGATLERAPRVGDVVAVVGTQPANGGVLVAETIGVR